MTGTNTKLKAGDILIDSSVRTTFKVVRLVGSDLVEITNIGVNYTNSSITDRSKIERGIASGNIKRI